MSARANTTSHSEWSAAPEKSFIATKAFTAEFYQYTASRASDLSMKGELVLHAQATANRCPAGRVLHANGKKLIPGVNPMTVFTTPAAATIQAPKFMLGVYDPESMLNGFIDPTSATFAVYDKNRPASAYLSEATGNVAEATAVAALGGQGAEFGTNAADVLVAAASNAATSGTANVGAARAGTITFVAGSTDAVTTVVVTATTVAASSIVLLSPTTAVAAYVTATAAGSFTVTTTASAATKPIKFVVVN